MNKNKFTFLVVTLAALLISVPQFSNAQSAPSIGANELRAQKNLDDAARAELKTNPAGGNALGTAMNGCMNLGVRTFTITRGKYSTIWLSGESACAFGEVVSGGESDPF
ncbi:MAG TPA: hypothetical protein VEC17_00520, partial [Candidatus Binatia bacterium]|nr:hypothetical protein [Candidatus Binatia bacterium]